MIGIDEWNMYLRLGAVEDAEARSDDLPLAGCAVESRISTRVSRTRLDDRQEHNLPELKKASSHVFAVGVARGCCDLATRLLPSKGCRGVRVVEGGVVVA